MVYATTLSESQRVMCWRLILNKFGHNIHHKDGVEKIVADMLSILTYSSINKYETSTTKAQCRADELFAIVRV